MKRWSFFAACMAGLSLIVLALFLNTPAQGQEPQASVQSRRPAIRQDPPTILAISPDEASNNLDTTIVITGTGFQAVMSSTQVLTVPAIGLGDFDLPDVSWISSRTLTAMVPWGLDPGVYTATVTNPDGQFGSLPRAFTVTQAIGVWTTGGPYGGNIQWMAVSPVVSRTAFAAVFRVGLYRTDDGGDHWQLAHYDPIPWGVGYGLPPANPLYYWGVTGLWRSDDQGLSFQQMLDTVVAAFAVNPTDPQTLWAGTYPHNLLYTTNGGVDWQERYGGLPEDAYPLELEIDPQMPSTLYTVLSDGRVFKTTNTGVDWLPSGSGLSDLRADAPFELAIDPFAPNVLLWANASGAAPAHRSVDGGQNWSPMPLELQDTLITDVAFSPYVSGTVYSSLMGDGLVGVSADGGATWEQFAPRGARDHVVSIALDPGTGLPAYLGGVDSGVSRSHDGGRSWEVATQGIPGLQVGALAAVPGSPETVYAGASGAGGFISNNAGHSWRQVMPFFAQAIAVDPRQPQRVYIHSGYNFFRSQDAGATWEDSWLPDDPQNGFVGTLAVADSAPSTLYAAGRNNDVWNGGGNLGVAYRSDDSGTTWQPLTFTIPISIVTDIIVSPVDSQTVYLAASNWPGTSARPGTGIFRSSDAGKTWQKINHGMADLAAFSLAIHPDFPQTIYATAWLTDERKLTVLRSEDGGDSWSLTTLRAYEEESPLWSPPIIIDPLAPDTVFVGGADGLYRTDDAGATWTKAAGQLGEVQITALAAAADDQRTIVYVGTIGGLAGGALSEHDRATTVLQDRYVDGGVYQQTIVHRAMTGTIYLPFILRKQ
jgi:photosystem II stability/assembly factor-like uncharacterized protein